MLKIQRYSIGYINKNEVDKARQENYQTPDQKFKNKKFYNP